MYLNSVLTKLDKQEIDTGMGYNAPVFIETEEEYHVDRQPYSASLARKQYGLTEEGVIYRAFTQKKGLKTGDYVKCAGDIFVVMLVNDWENHSEIVLGVAKDG